MVDGKGTHNVKILTEKIDKNDYAAYTHMGNGKEGRYAYYRQRERWQGLLLTANGKSTIEMQKTSAIDNRFSN